MRTAAAETLTVRRQGGRGGERRKRRGGKPSNRSVFHRLLTCMLHLICSYLTHRLRICSVVSAHRSRAAVLPGGRALSVSGEGIQGKVQGLVE